MDLAPAASAKAGTRLVNTQSVYLTRTFHKKTTTPREWDVIKACYREEFSCFNNSKCHPRSLVRYSHPSGAPDALISCSDALHVSAPDS